MNMVECVTSDSVIWKLDKFVADLCNASKKGPVSINFLREGPCCQSINLEQIVQSIQGLEIQEIITSNQISSSNLPEIKTPFVELDQAKEKIKKTKDTSSSLDKRFGMFISRSNWARLGLASHVWHNHKHTTLMTYHYNNKDDYHKANFGLEVLLQNHWEARHSVFEFIEHLPLTPYGEFQYPILWNENAFDLDTPYRSIFCEIVCETYFSGKTFMMTEKTMRAIIQRKPFVVQGPKNYLKNLKKLGFKTFDPWWDESYDMDGPIGQYGSIRWTIDYIGQQSQSTIQDWYYEMQPVLEHNVKVLNELTNEKILNTTFLYDN